MAWIGALIGAAGSYLASQNAGSNAAATGVNPATQMPSQGSMAQNLYGADVGYMGQAGQYYGMDPNYANQAFANMYANPYAAGMQSAAGQAGATAGEFAPFASAAGMQTLGAGQQALGAGQQIWNTAQDPQSALFNQLQNQVQQQSNVTNSQYGLGASPAGAAVANQNLANFDINWQNQQLARQMQGQNALNAGLGAYQNAANAGLGMGQTGIGLQQQAGALPYQAGQNIAANQFGALAQNQAAMQGGLQPYQQNINNMDAYLGLGQAAQAQANQQAYQQQLLQQQNIANLAQFGTQAYGAYRNQQQPVYSTQTDTTGGGSNTAAAQQFYSPGSYSDYQTLYGTGG